jgi:hypothetical protein
VTNPRVPCVSFPGVAAKVMGPARTGAAAPNITADLTADLAAALRAGRITPRAAIEKVIDRVVDRQLGADAPPAVREQVRIALADAVADDPLLGEKLGQL